MDANIQLMQRRTRKTYRGIEKQEDTQVMNTLCNCLCDHITRGIEIFDCIIDPRQQAQFQLNL